MLLSYCAILRSGELKSPIIKTGINKYIKIKMTSPTEYNDCCCDDESDGCANGERLCCNCGKMRYDCECEPDYGVVDIDGYQAEYCGAFADEDCPMQDLGDIGVTSMSEIQRIAELQENLRLVLHAEAESPDDARIKACIARIIDGIQNLEKAESTQQATAPPADHINNMITIYKDTSTGILPDNFHAVLYRMAI